MEKYTLGLDTEVDEEGFVKNIKLAALTALLESGQLTKHQYDLCMRRLK